MGFAFTCSEVDGADIANCTCEEFLDNKKLDQYHIVATINRVKTLLTKSKEPREMAFIELRDRTQKNARRDIPRYLAGISLKAI